MVKKYSIQLFLFKTQEIKMNNKTVQDITQIVTLAVVEALTTRGLLKEENKLTEREIDMMLSQLESLILNSKDIHSVIKEHGHAPAWAESKVSNASSMMAKLRSYMVTEAKSASMSGKKKDQ